MVRKFGFFLFFTLSFVQLFAQDQHFPLSANPSLFHLNPSNNANDKQLVLEDSVVYQYDTLSLPFIDGFNENHLPNRANLNNASINDTTLYKIYNGTQVDRSGKGYRIDTTFYYQIGALGDTLIRQPNGIIPLTVYDITKYPSSSSISILYPSYTIFDTIGKTPDTIAIAPNFEQDSAKFYIVPPNSNDWYTDRDVLINSSFPLNPKGWGVATFDGLNQYGLPYSPDFAIKGKADQLTSAPIDLGDPNLSDVYFSFYYQAGGLSLFGPEAGDSLALDFYDASSGKWGHVWATGGFDADTFRFQMIAVEQKYLDNGFQFRFRNYAQGAGAYDHWHIDQLYLDANRSAADTVFKDLAFPYPAKPLLKDYYVMPWWHFKSNPANYQTTNSSVLVQNNSNEVLNVFYNITLQDTLNAANTPYYSFPANNVFRVALPKDTFFQSFPINYSYQADSVRGPGKFETIYNVNSRPGANQPKDLFPLNDTLRTGIELRDYYAYDDGTAEVGYGINPQLGSEGYVAYMAVQFQIPFPDTIGGIQLYFLPQFPDISAQQFELVVWNSLSPGGIIFRKPIKDKPIYSEDNGFVTYWFDSLVVVNQSFFVGIRAIGQYSLNIGYDRNSNHKSQIFWSFNGVNWNNPSAGIRDGSLMLRPIFRKRNFGVGIAENLKAEKEIDLYPNPAQNSINYKIKDVDLDEYRVFHISGKTVKFGKANGKVELDGLSPGFYFLELRDKEGKRYTKKFIKSL